jgi:Uma2 family endonuclease
MSISTAIAPPRTMMEVFNSLPEGTLVQLIENNIVMSPAPLTQHQSLSIQIASELFLFVKKEKLGKVFASPFDVYLDRKNAFQPDICFIGIAKLDLIKKDGLHGAPDLVIEILSPSTAKYDLNDKKDVYERYGVAELWLVDPADKSVTGYYLTNGEYQLFYSSTGKITSKLLDFSVEF